MNHNHHFKPDGVIKLNLPYRRGYDLIGSLRQRGDVFKLEEDDNVVREYEQARLEGKSAKQIRKIVGRSGTNGRCIRGVGWIKCDGCGLREKAEYIWS